MKNKDQSIETLRGIAIILVVAGYIVQDDFRGTLNSELTIFFEHVYYFLKPIRLPLFTVISGFLYAASPATRQTFKKLFTGKSRRILIPYVVVSAIQYSFFSIFNVQGQHPLHHILKIYLWPFEQFWFLWAIFWIFMGVGLLDSIKALDTAKKWLGWLAFSISWYLISDPPYLLGLHGISYLVPFFLIGYGIRRYAKQIFSSRLIVLYIASSFISYAVYLDFYTPKVSLFDTLPYKILLVWVSCSVLPLIFRFRQNIPALAFIGYYAFGIHVFNKIATVLPRMVFERLQVSNEIVIMISYLICTILISIIIQTLLERFDISRRFILGMKKVPIPPPPPPLQPREFSALALQASTFENRQTQEPAK